MATRTRREFEQRHLIVPRSARYAVLGSYSDALSEVWIVCHGYGQLAGRFLARFLPLESERRLIVAPEALSRYYLSDAAGIPHTPDSAVGATWMTAEDRDCEIDDYVQYLDLLYNEIFSHVVRDKVRLWVLGFSQGVATVSRWVSRRNVDAERVVLWSGSLPTDLSSKNAASLSAKSPVLLVTGDRDRYVTPEKMRETTQMLDSLRVPYELFRHNGGHEIDQKALVAIAGRENIGE